MDHLAGFLENRYLRLGALSDLEESIRLTRGAVETMSDTRARGGLLSINLGNRLSLLWSRTRTPSVLDEAIDSVRRGMDINGDELGTRLMQLDILAVLLGKRHMQTQKSRDLDEAIKVARDAVKETPQDHAYRFKVLNNLGDELGNFYDKTSDLAHLDEAITRLREAVETTPQDHPDLSALLGNLGDRLRQRSERSGGSEDRLEAISHYQRALDQQNSLTLSRIWAARGILQCAAGWQQTSQALKVAVGLVPRLTQRSLRNMDKQHALGQVVGLASDAAAAAIFAGEEPVSALSLLEQGRGVLGASLEEFRTDLGDLRVKNPKLADEFLLLRDRLDVPISSNPRLEDETSEAFFSQGLTSHRYDTGKKFDELVAKIQKTPGLESFLSPPTQQEIQGAAIPGPIVIVNVSKYGCDALLVEPESIKSLHLDRLSFEDIQEKSRSGDLGGYDVLEWLWDAVAEPVLEALGFKQPIDIDQAWPHVWWIPTGALSRFPIHAAGHHLDGSSRTVLDRAMSSYASSIKSLIHSRRRQSPPAIGSKALIVAMQHTAGSSHLPFAPKEAAMLWPLCQSIPLQVVEPGGRKQDVEGHLRDCRVFHFAGHGATDLHDASKSHMMLEDGQITVAELLEMNMAEHSPFLAYLSACSTGRIQDQASVDESIHMMGAFQLAGFRHVVGTLWEVNDELCVEMAKLTYEGMRYGGMTDDSVCAGLHHASRKLRETHVRRFLAERSMESRPQTKAVGSGGSFGARHASLVNPELAGWAPYIHFGV
jgi:tetratricopeptide (TPR) repeat protein